MTILTTLGTEIDLSSAECFDGRSIVKGYKEGYQLIQKPDREPISVESEFTVAECYMMGLYLGDGCMGWRMNKKGDMRLYTCVRMVVHEDSLDMIKEALGARGLTYEGRVREGANGRYFLGSSAGWGVRSHASKVYELCGMTDEKHIPEFIYSSCEEKKAAMVAGLFDSDGTVGRFFSNNSLDLSKGFARLCFELGMPVNLTANKDNHYSVRVYKGFGAKVFIDKIPIQLGYKKAGVMEYSNSREGIGFNFDRGYVDELNRKISGERYDRIKCRLREYIRGHRLTITYGMMEDMIECLPEENTLRNLIQYFPCGIFMAK